VNPGFQVCFSKFIRANLVPLYAAGSVLILPEHRVEVHVLDDGSSGVGADAAAGALVSLSLVDHPPPGVLII
jgi:hypothetical protein